jgi:hypothetical protein
VNRRFLSAFLALAAIVLMAQPAAAQRFGFGRSSNSLVGLAANEAVQKELGISAEGANKLRSLSDDYRAASQKESTALGIDFAAIGDLPRAEQAAKNREVNATLAEMTRKLTAEYLPKLREVLDDEQLSRLRQIQLQAMGIDAYSEPEVASALAFTDEQKQKLVDLKNEYNRKQQDLDGDFQQRFARIRELNAERDKLALETLTSAQKSQLQLLHGKPFDTTQLGFGRRRNN